MLEIYNALAILFSILLEIWIARIINFNDSVLITESVKKKRKVILQIQVYISLTEKDANIF